MCFPKPKRNRVFPIQTRKAKKKEFTEIFSLELIPCGGCQQVFTLGSDELKIHCNLCNQFFHCQIAGKCRGEDCQIIKHTGYKHRARYCIHCVSRIFPNGECLCKECCLKDYSKLHPPRR